MMVQMRSLKPPFILIKPPVLSDGISLVLGRQARAETFSDGAYRNIFTLYRDQKLLVADTLRFTGNDRVTIMFRHERTRRNGQYVGGCT